MEDKQRTKVIFRMFKGECLAIFPEEIGNMDLGTCSCFALVGQHSACHILHVIQNSTPATEEEYKETKRVLENAYVYHLDIRKRYTQQMFDKRKEAYHAFEI